jgi:hypothetical protein
VEYGRDISNQRLQTYTLDADRPEVSYIKLDKGYIILTYASGFVGIGQ